MDFSLFLAYFLSWKAFWNFVLKFLGTLASILSILIHIGANLAPLLYSEMTIVKYSQNGTFLFKIFLDKKNWFWSLGIRIGTQSLWKLSLTKKFPNSLLPVYDSSVKTCQISYNHIYSSPKKYWQVRQPLPFLSPRHNMIPCSEVLLSLGDFFLWDKSNKRSSVWV